MSLQNPTRTVKKFEVENYSKTSGIAATTWYTAFDETNIEKVIAFYFKQDNTTPANLDMQFRWTIDGFEIVNAGAGLTCNDNTPYFLKPGPIGGGVPMVGDPPEMTADSVNATALGIEFAMGGGIINIPLGGKSVKLEYYFNSIGTGQEFHADIYHEHLEAV